MREADLVNIPGKSGLLAVLLSLAAVMLEPAAVAETSRPASAPDFPPLFNTVGYPGDGFSALPQWRRVLREIEQEAEIYQDCADALAPCPSPVLLAWQAMIKGQVDQPGIKQLRAVNRFVNRWTTKSDQANYQMSDHWASPLAFLSRSGDGEDFAIIKYASLRQLGFSPKQLRIVVVRDVLRDLPHAVLAVHANDEVFIMDNLFNAVLPQHRVNQYLPYYSVNEHARFSHLPARSVMMAMAAGNRELERFLTK